MENDLTFRSLGLINYQDAYEAMKAHIADPDFKNEIWLLQHPPVFTLGTAASKEHVLNAKEIPVIQTDRGGEVTFHGPGQLVIYFLLDIKTFKWGPKALVQNLENFIQDLLQQYSIETNIISGAPGVYVGNEKIASIGLRISRGKTYHGISLNVDMDLSPFLQINPCGYEGLKVTQIKDFIDTIDINEVESLAIQTLGSQF
ncbi:lipoyl(octanoyl) transferase LipB [Gammaproteobacteria bacterium]|nr:lipoyl(octanoyl) transferase LipB [Gammaproteobacteria bacterium]